MLKARSWRFGIYSVPSLDFGGTFVPYFQRQDVNPTVEDFLDLWAGILPPVAYVPL